MMVCDITSEQIGEVLDKQTPSMRNAYMKCLGAFFNHAIHQEWLVKNPIKKLKFAKLAIREVEVVPVPLIEKMHQRCVGE
jgi:hypothetical protein